MILGGQDGTFDGVIREDHSSGGTEGDGDAGPPMRVRMAARAIAVSGLMNDVYVEALPGNCTLAEGRQRVELETRGGWRDLAVSSPGGDRRTRPADSFVRLGAFAARPVWVPPQKFWRATLRLTPGM